MTPAATAPDVQALPVGKALAWMTRSSGSRLLLPPIQRSAVWRNTQIIHYWDSLLRGYPAGLMMIHAAQSGQGRDADGITCDARDGDFLLFDGQQRMTALLLGAGLGQLREKLKLWVEFGSAPDPESGLRFALRMSSAGQPFGYRRSAANEKYPLPKRREAAEKREEGLRTPGLDSPVERPTLGNVDGAQLIDARNPVVPLQEVLHAMIQSGVDDVPQVDAALKALQSGYPDIDTESARDLLAALARLLDTRIIFQSIDTRIVTDPDEYIRFFGRLGQGGTALSNNELTYSIIKHHYPYVHDQMARIMDRRSDQGAGRIAGEISLVLATLRVAKVKVPMPDAKDRDIMCRPYPAQISRLRDSDATAQEFRRLVGDATTAHGVGLLAGLLRDIRHWLAYDGTNNPGGLPGLLLARLPHGLVDVLLLMAADQRDKADALPAPRVSAFALHWLLFVGDDEQAADLSFAHYRDTRSVATAADLALLAREFRNEGIARRLPAADALHQVREDIKHHDHRLRIWSDRFSVLDADKERPCGDALRVLSTHGEIIKRALMWLQRGYLETEFGHFDPTSDRDEDLPVDLDHLLPVSHFGFDWRERTRRLAFNDEGENFRARRSEIGNSLGNYRWLDASKNRSRQAGALEPLPDGSDLIDLADEWNSLIARSPWDLDDVSQFQRLIDLRSLNIYEALLRDGGLAPFAQDTP